MDNQQPRSPDASGLGSLVKAAQEGGFAADVTRMGSAPSSGADPLLVSIVKAAQVGGGLTVDVTLCTRGLIVSGVISTAQDFANDFARQVKAASGAKGADAQRIDAAFTLDPPSLGYTPNHIHLRGARFFSSTGATLPSSDSPGVFWRGRLDAIDGWWLGQLMIS